PDRVLTIDLMVRESHHDFRLQARFAQPDAGGSDAAGIDVGKYPFVVAALLFDVLRNCITQPVQAWRQTATARHEQRNRMLDVVIGFSEKCYVLGQPYPAAQRL